VADAALRLDDAIQEALRSRRPTAVDRPLILIAHSMGGLVARYWLAVLGGWRYCHALLALGVPHRGAPKALAWLVNGVGVGPIRHQRATEVIRGWPSAYELLPQYPAVWDPGAKAGSGAAVEFTKLPSALVRGHPDLASYASRFAAAAAAGRLIHEQITNDWAKIDVEQAPQVISYMGRGHATPNLAVLQGDRLRIRKRDPHWRGNVGWRGDGTVPMLSAIPHEQSDRQDLWRVMADRHGPLGSIPEPVKMLGLYAGDKVPVRGGPWPERPWLGLNIDDFALAGAETPLEARLWPESLTGDPAWVTMTPLDGTPGGVHTDRLSRQTQESPGAVWRGTLPGRPAGIYEVAVEVADVAGYGTVGATATVCVLDTTDGPAEAMADE
jgi:hypothetical protein